MADRSGMSSPPPILGGADSSCAPPVDSPEKSQAVKRKASGSSLDGSPANRPQSAAPVLQTPHFEFGVQGVAVQVSSEPICGLLYDLISQGSTLGSTMDEHPGGSEISSSVHDTEAASPLVDQVRFGESLEAALC